MDIEKFISTRQFLYHLTDKRNLPSILDTYTLKSTKVLVNESTLSGKANFLKARRQDHYALVINGNQIFLRDQHPLSEKIVMKNMTPGWTFGDFVYSLNSRVFFWSTEKDLRSHYSRYEKKGEFPVILRVDTSEMIATNSIKPQFCKYNSGGPRCHHSFPEGAAPRGVDTFLKAQTFPFSHNEVREVTFLEQCQLSPSLSIASHPDKSYRKPN